VDIDKATHELYKDLCEPVKGGKEAVEEAPEEVAPETPEEVAPEEVAPETPEETPDMESAVEEAPNKAVKSGKVSRK